MKKLIVGLGNPGKKYEDTAHNVGFQFVEYMARELGLKWALNKKFNAYVAEGTDLYLIKPQTFMNLSGTPVQKFVSYYEIPQENLIVVHDEVDLPFQNFKIQQGRGSAGHNGVKDIISHLGENNFWRVRIGVGRPENNQYDLKDFVLSTISADIKDIFPEIRTQLAL